MSQRIRIKLKSYDHNLVDKSQQRKNRENGKGHGSRCKRTYSAAHTQTYLHGACSPHVNKKAREQFELFFLKRLMDIYSSSTKTIDALMKLEFAQAWVEVEIKV